MTKTIVLLWLLVIPAGALAKDRSRVVLDFATMYGVDEEFVGEDNPIRGIVGDELHGESRAESTAASRTAGISGSASAGSSSPTIPRCRRSNAAPTTSPSSARW
jgi:hypothetical protein